MSSDARINDMLSRLLGQGVEGALTVAAEVDDLEESDAVITLAMAIHAAKTPPVIMALQLAALTVRWHRTRQIEAAVNTPAPGQ